MAIRVEFFGVARSRAGVAETTVDTGGSVALDVIFAELSRRFPNFAAECLEGGSLRRGYIANLGGERFVRDANELVADGQSVLILSADAGG